MIAHPWQRFDAQGLSTATAHEAAGRIGSLPSAIKPVDPAMRVAGPAFTVKSPAGDNLFLHHAIERAAPGDVLVVDCSGGVEFGYWGEVMSTAAQARDLGGLVLAGGVRDAQQLIALGFPVFSVGLCIRGTVKDPKGDGAINQAITIGDVVISPGDLILGDADGVLAIPAAAAAAVIATARQRDTDEIDILTRLRSGETTLGIYQLPGLAGERVTRRSISVPGLDHPGLPIPAASRVGPLLATGGIRGVDAATGIMPEDAAGQTRLMFANLAAIVAAGGGTTDDIVKMTIWIATPDARAAINEVWTTLFPDPAARPARHTLSYDLPGGMLVQCDALAYIQDGQQP